MTLIKFGKEHKLGHKEIDKQHKEIFETVNHIYEIKDHEKKEIIDSFNNLLSQLKVHFVSEELFMKEKKVVEFISHKLEHDRALTKYNDYLNNWVNKSESFDSDILFSLKHWLESHFEKKDKQLINYISKN